MNIEEESISELEDIITETIQNEKQREKDFSNVKHQ